MPGVVGLSVQLGTENKTLQPKWVEDNSLPTVRQMVQSQFSAPYLVAGSAPLAVYRELLWRNALTSSVAGSIPAFLNKALAPPPLLTRLPYTSITALLFELQTQTV